MGKGRIQAPEVTRTPESGNVDSARAPGHIQPYIVALERRLPMDIALDVANVGTRGDGGYADIDINAPIEIGTGNQERPYASGSPLL